METVVIISKSKRPWAKLCRIPHLMLTMFVSVFFSLNKCTLFCRFSKLNAFNNKSTHFFAEHYRKSNFFDITS